MKAKFMLQSLAIKSVVVVGMLFALGACSEKADDASVTAGKPIDGQESDGLPRPPKVEVSANAQFALSNETPDSIAEVQTSGVCSLENIVTIADNASSPGDKPNSYKVKNNEAYRVVGFSTNKDRGTVSEDIEIVISGLKSYSVRLTTGGPREDVAKYFNNPDFAKAGYMHDVAFSNVEPGDYAIYVLEHDGAKKAACSTSQSITVI